MSKVTPIITGLDKPIKVDLGKRLAYISKNIVFECPECGYEVEFLDDPADLEYGSFYGVSECGNCDAEFEEYTFDVKATVTISIKEK